MKNYRESIVPRIIFNFKHFYYNILYIYIYTLAIMSNVKTGELPETLKDILSLLICLFINYPPAYRGVLSLLLVRK